MNLLAIELRPNKIEDVIGQKHLLGEDKVLKNMINNGKLFSMILYGKPGIGKTTIALAICSTLNIKHKVLNAVINKKLDFSIAIEEAKMNNGMVLIIDEIHRMNKDKQDILLPYLESGLITLIGLTTSNPYHKINPAIRSRVQIYELLELNEEELNEGVKRAKKHLDAKIDKKATDRIIDLSNGDLRYLYNLIEVAFYSTKDKKITLEVLNNISNKSNVFFDSSEDGHYDIKSALQKSIRGSDVNASLYYLAILIEAGDLDTIYRRLTVIAYEDISLANPSIGPKIDSAINACERLGLPEGRIPLGQIVIEMALSPKSNTAHIALDSAINDIRKGNVGNVPIHLKKGSKDYKYPHNYPNNFIKQQYLPDKLINREYFNPKDTSKYEENLKNIYNNLKNR